MLKQFVFSFACFCFATASLSAHDYWLQPATYFPKVGKKIEVRLYVGDHDTSELERVFQKSMTPSFQFHSKGSVVDLASIS